MEYEEEKENSWEGGIGDGGQLLQVLAKKKDNGSRGEQV